ncbi:MAG: DUF6965 family protein [Bacteroidaceae bacterium]
MMEYKEIYSSEEVAELEQWYAAHRASLPRSVRLDVGTFIPDLPSTVDSLLSQARMHREVPAFAYASRMLLAIRQVLTQEGEE